MTRAESAADYLSRGWSLHPLKEGEKDPASPNGFKDAQLEWPYGNRKNIGIACGASDLVVLDRDPTCDEKTFREWLTANDWPLDTYQVKTPRGEHFYYRQPNGTKYTNGTKKLQQELGLPKGVDIRGVGGYVVAAGSFIQEKQERPGGAYLVQADLPLAQAPDVKGPRTDSVPPTAGRDRRGQVNGSTHAQAIRDALASGVGRHEALAEHLIALVRFAKRGDQTMVAEIPALRAEWVAELPDRADEFDRARASAEDRVNETADEKPDDKRPSMATELARFAEQTLTFYRDTDGTVFTVDPENPGIAVVGEQIATLITRLWWKRTHGTARRQAVIDALYALLSDTYPTRPLSVRVARIPAGYVIDLGDGHFAHVTPGRWHVNADPGEAMFRRKKGFMPLPEPRGKWADIGRLWSHVRATPAQRGVVVGWLIAALMPDRPCPILLITGEQGTAKTSSGRRLIAAVDPQSSPLRQPPHSEIDWTVAAGSSRAVGLDNVSHIEPWFSDALCRVVTGDALVKRALYSDDGLSVVAARSAVLITAISVGALRDDLISRLVFADLEPVPAGQYRSESDLDRQWAEDHPMILGGLLDLLAKVLASDAQADGSDRLADFAETLSRIDDVSGSQVYKSWSGDLRSAQMEAVEDDPFASAVFQFMAGRDQWSGSAGELLVQLTEPGGPDGRPLLPDRRGREWTPRGVAGALKRASAGLRLLGVSVSQAARTHGGHRGWHLVAVEPPRNVTGDGSVTVAPARTSPANGQVSAGTAGRGGGGDGSHAQSSPLSLLASLEEEEEREEHSTGAGGVRTLASTTVTNATNVTRDPLGGRFLGSGPAPWDDPDSPSYLAPGPTPESDGAFPPIVGPRAGEQEMSVKEFNAELKRLFDR